MGKRGRPAKDRGQQSNVSKLEGTSDVAILHESALWKIAEQFGISIEALKEAACLEVPLSVEVLPSVEEEIPDSNPVLEHAGQVKEGKANPPVAPTPEKEVVSPIENIVITGVTQRLSWENQVEGMSLKQGETQIEEPPKIKENLNLQGTGQSWAELVRKNRSIVKCGLEYIEQSPGPVVFTDEEWDDGRKLWKYAVISRVASHTLSYPTMVRWIEVTWGNYKPHVSQVKPGIFLFNFHSEEDRTAVLRRKWTFYHKFPVQLKVWDGSTDFDKISFGYMPVWINLLGLHPRFWSTRNLSKLVSYIGRPLAADHMTVNRIRMDYARVFIEVKMFIDLPETIPIIGPDGGEGYQKVEYEWNITKCAKCGWIGHVAEKCRRKEQVEKNQKANIASGSSIVVNPPC